MKASKRRVVVTGIGVVSPIGIGASAFWDSVKKGTNGIDNITLFDASDIKVKLNAEVQNFDPTEYLDPRSARRLERFTQFAVVAANEAMKDSRIDMEKEDPYRIGVSVGSGVGSIQIISKNVLSLDKIGPRGVEPLLIPSLLTNMAAGNIAIAHNLRGKNINVAAACATGGLSIGEAFRSIQYGDADVMLAGGTEAPHTKIGTIAFAALGAETTASDKNRASIPFDKERSGFVMGEGAGVVVLEELERAKKRGAKIYAEVIGYGATSDAYHITAPRDDASSTIKAIELALEDAGVDGNVVDYINAHGTSTKYNDLYETIAIKTVFKEHAKDIRINSTKSMIGHLMGAAGGVEFVTTVLSVQNDFVHQTINHKVDDEELTLNYMFDGGENCRVNYAISNSFGFGGHNATLLIKKFDE